MIQSSRDLVSADGGSIPARRVLQFIQLLRELDAENSLNAFLSSLGLRVSKPRGCNLVSVLPYTLENLLFAVRAY